MAGFLKHPLLFEDKYQVEDLFNLEEYAERIWGKVQTMENKSIFGYIGPYGCGKSTIIHNVCVNHSGADDPIWVQFDAWKYHDKKDLWEGFIIDLGIQLGGITRDEITKVIDGNNITFGDGLLTTLSVLPGLGGVESLKKIFESRGISRVFEFQELLRKFILSNKRDIVIVIEDIDRAGSEGLTFLETLNFFIKSELEAKNIKIITLIGKESYNDYINSFIKCLDITEFFRLPETSFENFVTTHFDLSIYDGTPHGLVAKSQLTSFFEKTAEFMTLRKIKHIIRAANNNFILQKSDGYSPDFRVTLAIEFSKYIQDSHGVTDFEKMKGGIVWDSLGAKFLKLVAFRLKNFIEYETRTPLTNARLTSTIKWHDTIPNTDIFIYDDISQILPNFYLNY